MLELIGANHPDRYYGYNIRRLYGISLEDYNRLLAEQGGVCAICKEAQQSGKSRLVVDHDHETNKVRGLLCTNCNTMLGKSHDSEATLQSAIDYLRRTG
jgi:hypothetical protein